LKKSKILLIIGIFLVLIIGVIIIGSPSKSLPVSPTQEDKVPTYQERLNSMTIKDCENVTGSSLPEVRDRCQQIWKYAPASIAANTQEKKDKTIQKLEETYLFTNYDLDALHFNITEDMLTPEGLKICVDLWEDMVQKTLKIRTGDPKTIGKSMEAQDNFQRSSCAGTQDKWKDPF